MIGTGTLTCVACPTCVAFVIYGVGCAMHWRSASVVWSVLVGACLEEQLKAVVVTPMGCVMRRRVALEVCRVLVGARLEQQTNGVAVAPLSYEKQRREAAVFICVR